MKPPALIRRTLLDLRYHLAARALPALLRGHDRTPIDPSQVNRILVIRNDEIGDFVLTSPFLRELRRFFPHREIALVVKPAVRGLADRCPYVDRVLTFSGAAPPAQALVGAPEWRAYRFVHDVMEHQPFDLAIVPRWDTDAYGASALAWFSQARWRVGYSERVSPTKARWSAGYDAFFTHVMDDRELRHEAERPLALLRWLGGTVSDSSLEVWTNSEDEAFARAVNFPKEAPCVAISPGAGAAHRRWPPERFAAVGRYLQERYGATVILLGGPDDTQLSRAIAEGLSGHTIDLTGRANLPQSAAILQRCQLFIGNDSGPMHLAAAAKVPVVEVSCHPRTGDDRSAHAPQRFGPWGVPHRIVQPVQATAPCSSTCTEALPHCILEVSAEQVIEAVDSLLQLTHSNQTLSVPASAER